MAIAFVQEKIALSGAASPATITLTASVTAGSTLLVGVICNGSITSVSGCGATWSQVVGVTDSTPKNYELWKGVGTTSGTTISVSVSGTFSDIHVSEWSGIASITGFTTTAADAAPHSASLSLAATNVGYSFLAWQTHPTTTNGDTPVTWTSLTGGYDSTVENFTIDPAYRVPSGSESAQRAWTLGGGAVHWGGVSAVLVPVATSPYRSPHLSVVRQAVRRASVI